MLYYNKQFQAVHNYGVGACPAGDKRVFRAGAYLQHGTLLQPGPDTPNAHRHCLNKSTACSPDAVQRNPGQSERSSRITFFLFPRFSRSHAHVYSSYPRSAWERLRALTMYSHGEHNCGESYSVGACPAGDQRVFGADAYPHHSTLQLTQCCLFSLVPTLCVGMHKARAK
jgi:hypothetical protein